MTRRTIVAILGIAVAHFVVGGGSLLFCLVSGIGSFGPTSADERMACTAGMVLMAPVGPIAGAVHLSEAGLLAVAAATSLLWAAAIYGVIRLAVAGWRAFRRSARRIRPT